MASDTENVDQRRELLTAGPPDRQLVLHLPPRRMALPLTVLTTVAMAALGVVVLTVRPDDRPSTTFDVVLARVTTGQPHTTFTASGSTQALLSWSCDSRARILLRGDRLEVTTRDVDCSGDQVQSLAVTLTPGASYTLMLLGRPQPTSSATVLTG